MPTSVLDFFLNVEKTLELYRIDEDSCKLIRGYTEEAHDLIPHFLEEMQSWIEGTNIFKVLYDNENTIHQFQDNQKKYWKEFFEANIDKQYIDSRLNMGRYYAHINLPLSAYCALISYRLSWWVKYVNNSKRPIEEKVKIAEAIKRLILLDTGATCVAYSEATNRLIEVQNNTLLQLSTPTIQLWDGVLLLSIVGVLDSARAQHMMDELLKRVVSTASPVSIIDIFAVPNVDSSVANHLIKVVKATKLLGNTCILSGISPEVAQTLVEVGVDLREVNTTSTLRHALKMGLDMVGMSIKLGKSNEI